MGDLILVLVLVASYIAAAVFVGRRVVRHVRQLPPRREGAPDVRVLRHRLLRVVLGLALVFGFLHFVGEACANEDGFSRGLFVVWERAGLAVVAAAVVAPLVARRVSGDAWATSSFVLPAVGLALALPPTLQLVAFRIADQTMDEWCKGALPGAAIAHIVFAILFAVRTVSLARTGRSALSIGELFTLVTLAGAIPGFIIGMGFVAFTGVFVLPVISLVDWLALREHAATAAGLPRAIVAPCRA